MKLKEIDIILRLNAILTKIPPPKDGMDWSPSATIKGFIEYSEDMRGVTPMLQRILMGMVHEDLVTKNREEKDNFLEGRDYHSPTRSLDALEEWVKIRAKAGWKGVSMFTPIEIYEQKGIGGEYVFNL
jgi:hypothetical protein